MNRERSTENMNNARPMGSAENNGGTVTPKMNGSASGGMSGGSMHGTNGVNDRSMSAQSSRWRTSGAKESRELSELAAKIRELGFVKAELELYLDTHPTCKVAIDYYHRTVDALSALAEKYHAEGGNPLFASAGMDSEAWKWVDMPWPWQNGRGER